MSQFPPPVEGAPPPTNQPLRAKTSGLAVASLVLGILGFLTCGLTGLVGAILGVVALIGISKSAGTLRGQGMAISGLVTSLLSLLSGVFYGMVAAIVLPEFAMASQEAQLAVSVTRLETLASVTELYGVAHDGELPPVHDWVNAIDLWDRSALVSPMAPEHGRAYAMNIHLDGAVIDDVRDPMRTVLFFESDYRSPLAGGPEMLPATPRHFNGYLIVFVNGDVGVVPQYQLKELVWRP